VIPSTLQYLNAAICNELWPFVLAAISGGLISGSLWSLIYRMKKPIGGID